MEKNPPDSLAPKAAAASVAGPQSAHTRLPEEFYEARLRLQLSRDRILGNLARTTHPSHRAMLERALTDIERRLNPKP